jgi:hypothetical protein
MDLIKELLILILINLHVCQEYYLFLTECKTEKLFIIIMLVPFSSPVARNSLLPIKEQLL